MSFPRHWQIYQSDDCFGSPDGAVSGSAPSFIVSMSLGQLFLGGLVSTRAHLRFTSRFYLPLPGWNYQPPPARGWGIFDRYNGEFSTGVDNRPET